MCGCGSASSPMLRLMVVAVLGVCITASFLATPCPDDQEANEEIRISRTSAQADEDYGDDDTLNISTNDSEYLNGVSRKSTTAKSIGALSTRGATASEQGILNPKQAGS